MGTYLYSATANWASGAGNVRDGSSGNPYSGLYYLSVTYSGVLSIGSAVSSSQAGSLGTLQWITGTNPNYTIYFTTVASSAITGGTISFSDQNNNILAGGGSFRGWIISPASKDIVGIINTTNDIGKEANFLLPGTYTWTAPANVTSVSALCIGGGGGGTASVGGSGGSLSYNTFSVIPGNTYNIQVGSGGTSNNYGGFSYILNQSYTVSSANNENMTSYTAQLAGQVSTDSGNQISWTVPPYVTGFSCVLIGGGGSGPWGGGGGGLAYYTFSTTPGTTYTLKSGAGGPFSTGGTSSNNSVYGRGTSGGNSQLLQGLTVLMQANGGGGSSINNVYTYASLKSGGGAAGYSGTGAGGTGYSSITSTGSWNTVSGGAGGNGSGPAGVVVQSGGGAGGGAYVSTQANFGSISSYSTYTQNAKTGDGAVSEAGTSLTGPGSGVYGAGADNANGGPGGARIIWGANRSYPSTNVADTTAFANIFTFPINLANQLIIGSPISFNKNVGPFTANTIYYVGKKWDSTNFSIVNSLADSNTYGFFTPQNYNSIDTDFVITFSSSFAKGGSSNSVNIANAYANAGGVGGIGNTTGGGGTAGYSGAGGAGGANGAGGGAGGGTGGGPGAGVGIYGTGSTGGPGTPGSNGYGTFDGTTGGFWGGGGGINGSGAPGAVRIIWNTSASFPSTNTFTPNLAFSSTAGILNLVSQLVNYPVIPKNTSISNVISSPSGPYTVTLGSNPLGIGQADFNIGGTNISLYQSGISFTELFTPTAKLIPTARGDLNFTMTPEVFSSVTKRITAKQQDSISFTNSLAIFGKQQNYVTAQQNTNAVDQKNSPGLYLFGRRILVANQLDLNDTDLSDSPNIPTARLTNTLSTNRSDLNLSTDDVGNIGWG